MSFIKFSKVTAIIATSLLATSTLFAAGIKEVAPSSTIAMVENIEETTDTYNFQVLTDSQEFVVELDKENTSSVLDLGSFVEGDYVEIINLIENANTMSASSIRYITPLVLTGAINFVPTNPIIEVPEIDYGFDNDLNLSVNYSYGYLIESNFASQNTFVNAGYFIRGVFDAVNLEADSMFDVTEMNSFLEGYQAAVQADNSILPTNFGNDLSIEEIKELPKTTLLEEQFAYAYGFMFAANFVTNGFPMDVEYFSDGFLAAAFDKELKISTYQMQNAVRDFEEAFQAEQDALMAEVKSTNLKNAEDFLATNSTSESVVTTESGLQYKVLTAGDGAKPLATDTVTLNYELSTPTGIVLDSSFSRGAPSSFPLSAVIPGFREAVMNMNVGSSIIAWVHPTIGYGEEGNQNVEPNLLLIFKIDLISIDEVVAE